MKKILTLLILCMFCAAGLVLGQPNPHMNIPDTVCMSYGTGAGDKKFTSINSYLDGNGVSNVSLPRWTITRPGGSAADYNLVYSGSGSLTNTRSLTVEFLVPGTYTFTANYTYRRNGSDLTYSYPRQVVVKDCSIQTCNGGYAVMAGFNEDFGTMPAGVNRRRYPTDSVIFYTYQNNNNDLADNYYVIAGRTNMKGDWVNMPDHTGNTNGAMLVANSAYAPLKFYQKRVTGLCSGSVYNFSAWMMNLNPIGVFESGCISDYKYAGVSFQVVNAADTNQILANFKTYDVSMNLATPTWQRYGGQFTIPGGVKDVIVRIKNDRPGGCGNDIAIDDISFTYCSPIITAGIAGSGTTLKEVLCEGTAATLTSDIQPAGYFTNPVYQWEMSDDGGVSWKNVPYGTARNQNLDIPQGELKGTKEIAAQYLFRVRVYERGIQDSLGCANPSSPIEITILPMPKLTLSQSRVCAGAAVELQAIGNFNEFRWKDLPGFVGDRRTINLIGDTTITVYGYVYYGEGDGKTCVDSNHASIKVDDRPIVDVTMDFPAICFGETVNLRINDILGAPGNTIRWYRGSDSIPGHPQSPLPGTDDMTSIDVTPASIADSVFTVVVSQATCTVGSNPIIIKITPPLQRIKFPPQIQCSSENPDGVFFMPDSSLVAPHDGEIGSWRLHAYSGFEIAPDLTIDDYIRIFQPARMGTRVTIPTGSFVVLAWTAQNILNNNCRITSLDTLQLVDNPTASFAGDDSTQCGNNVFVMRANPVNGDLIGGATETGTWALLSGNATISDIHSPTATVTVTGAAPQEASLTWTITNEQGCSYITDTVVLRVELPPTAVIRPITICNTTGSFDIDTVSTFNNPLIYTVREAVPGTLPGFVSVTDTIRLWPITMAYPITPAIPAPGAYNFILTLSTGNAGCETDIPFTVNMSSAPTAPTGVTVSNPAICDTGSTTLSVIGGSLGTRADGTPDGRWYWYRNACGGSGNLPIDSGATIIVHGISATTTYYVRAEGTCGVTACADGTVTVSERPDILTPVGDMEHCNDSLFNMSATPASVGTGTWTVQNGIATITDIHNPNTTIFVLAGDTANVIWTVTNGSCVLSDTAFLRNNRNVLADAGNRQEHCNTAAFTLAGNNPAAPSTGRWTLASGTATITTPTAYNSAVNVPAGDSARLVWTITTGTCITTDTVVLVNFATPSPAVINGTVIEHCDVNVFNVEATDPAVGTGVWSVISGTATIISPTHDTSTVIVAAGTSATLQWTVSNGVCPPNTATIILRNYQAPAPIVNAPDQTHCNDSLFTMAATPASVGAGVWTVLSGTPAPTITTPSSPTTTVFVLAGDSATLVWTITNGVCVLRDTVVLRNNMSVPANAGNRQEQCNTVTFTMAANNPAPGTGLWTILSGTPTIATPTSNTTNVTVAAGDSAYLIWTITNGTCITRDTVSLVNFAPPSTVSAGTNQTHCSDSLFTMAADVPTVGTGVWSVVSGTATIETPASATSRVFVLSGVTAVLQWTISNGTCPATSSTVTLVNNAMPAKPNAGADQAHCATPAFTVTASASTIGTGVWTRIAGTGTITTPASNTTTVNVPNGDSTVLVWTLTNGTCSISDTVSLVNYAAPSPAVINGTLIEHCDNNVFNVEATDPAIGTGVWSVISGTATIISPNSDTSTVIVAAGTNATLQWTVSNGTCPPNTATIVLRNFAAPTAIVPAPDQTHCNDSLFVMAVTPASVGTGTWTVLSGTPAPTITNPSSATTNVFVLAGDSATLVWTITNGVCVIRDTVVLRNNRNVPADAGNRQEQCNTATFTMAANNPAPGTGLWTVLSGTPTIATPTSNTTSVTVAAGDSTYLIWTVTNGTCISRDTVSLVNFAPPSTVSAGTNQTHCSDSLFTMAADVPTIGTGRWTVASGTATIETPASATSRVFVLSGVTAVLQWTISNGTCPSTSSTVTLVNNAMPAKPNAGADQTQCDNPAFTVTASASTIGTGVWTRIAGLGTIATPASNTTTVNVPTGDSTVLVWTLTNGTCSISDTVSLKNLVQAADADAGTDQEHCGVSAFTLNGNDPGMASAQGTWTVVSPASVTIPAAQIHNRNAVVNVPAGITAVLRWTIVNSTCTTTDEVTLVNHGPIAGNTVSANQVLCPVDVPAPLTGGTVSGGTGTFTYQWIISTDSTAWSPIAGATNGASYAPASVSVKTWFRRVVVSGGCTPDTSNAVSLSVIDQNPVVISVPAAMTVECSATVDPTTLFGTPEFSHFPFVNETLTITFTDTPIPGTACNYALRRTWTATDRCGRTASAQQTITVMDRVAPVFVGTAPANVTVDCANVPAAVNMTANDACQGAMTITPTETRVDESATCTSNYRLTRTWTAVDACGNTSATLTQVITVRDLMPPAFAGTAPAAITVNCDNIPAGLPMTANDNCTPGPINVTPVDSVATPTGTCTSNYYIIRKWVAADNCGNTTILRQRINVQDTTRPVFSIPQPANITVNCDAVPALPTVTATDNCTPNVIVRVSERKDFLSTTCANNYRLTRTWTATDNCNNTTTMFQVIMVQDTTRPAFNVVPPRDTTISCEAIPAPPANMSATDNCSAPSNVRISYSQTRENIPGATCASNYRLVRTWTARDECGNTNIARQVITVVDTTAPVIDPAPADITVNCGETIQIAATLYARDNCDATFPKRAVMTEDPYVKDVCAGYTIIRRWRIADACGNQAIERVQRITVNPCPKPELDPNLPVNCSNNTKFAILLANKVSKPRFTLVSIIPASAVSTPLSQSSNVFDLKGATEATFTVTDGVTGCVSDPVTYVLQYTPKPVVNLGNDTTICQGETLTLDAGIANGTYTIRWSTGETAPTINVSAAGTYSVTVTNNGCSTTDNIVVKVTNPPVVDIPDADICDGQSVKLNAYVQGATYVWSTGETTPSITVSTAGSYTVNVTLGGCTTTDVVNVTVNPAPNVTVTPDTDICPDETLMLTVDPDGGNVQWISGETATSIVVSKPGDFWVKVTRNGCVVTDTVHVGLRPKLAIDLGPDRDICNGGRVVLDGTHPDAVSYYWNDGITTPVREITEPGRYTIAVMDRFCSQITMDSVNVNVTGLPTTVLPNDTTWCRGMPLVLTPKMGDATGIRWQDGSILPTYTVTIPGTYSVTVYNECGAVTDNITVAFKDCDPKPQFPNAFTPNGDGRNDVFKPVVQGPMYDYDLRIYNRWGEVIFLSRDSQSGWDGKYQGKVVPNGTYVWMLSYKKMMGATVNVVKGEVTVIR